MMQNLYINKFIYRFLIVVLLGTVTTNAAWSQCGMDHEWEAWKAQNPNHHILENPEGINRTQNVERRQAVYKIPVVFHVLHTNGPENISDEQILDQMRILNEDFNRRNPDRFNVRNTEQAPFAPLVTDMQIELVLAKRDPSGNCTDGINRIFTPLHENAHNNVKELIRWDVNRYLNIWVVSNIQNSSGSGSILGFANFPFMSAAIDGIVMRSDEIGSIGTGNRTRRGRTLTHEVGHYLGLFHTFQGGCTGQSPGDGIDDTPNVQSSESNRSCNPNNNSCPSSLYLDQWENYMDYSLGCQSMFTHGQKARAYFWLQNTANRRSTLVSNQNMIFTGIEEMPGQKPIAYFSSDRNKVCAGSPVQFFDLSCQGSVDQRSWQFQGANIVSSSQPSPTVIYENPGIYRVKLTVSNQNGTSDYEVEQFIEVFPAQAHVSGFAESFEDDFEFDKRWFHQTDAPGFLDFRITNQAAHFGSQSLVADVNMSNSGRRFILETPAVDLTLMRGENPRISFMVGYARRNTTQIEALRIYVSDDCGNTWNQRLFRQGGQIASNPAFISNFIPTLESDWTRIVLSLTEFENSTHLMVRIEVESGGGNPVYIDDINISQYFTSVPGIKELTHLNVFPNPSHDVFDITLESTDLNSLLTVDVFDVQGRKVAELFHSKMPAETHSLQFNPLEYNLKAGVYFLKVKSFDGVLTKKLIFAN